MKRYNKQFENAYRESMYDSARESFEYCVPVIMNGKRKKSLIEVMIEDESQIVKRLLEEDQESQLNHELDSVQCKVHNRIVDANMDGLCSNITEKVLLDDILELSEQGKWQEAFNALKIIKKYYEEVVISSDFVSEEKIQAYYKILNMLSNIADIISNNNKTL